MNKGITLGVGVLILIAAILLLILKECQKVQKIKGERSNFERFHRSDDLSEPKFTNEVPKIAKATDSISNWRSHWERGKRLERLKVADIDIPIIFERKPENNLAQVILADFDLIFRHLTSYSYFVPRTLRTFEIGGQKLSTEKGIQFDGKGSFWPNLLQGELMIVKQNNLDNIVISEKITLAYQEAWALRNENPGIYRSLEEFMEIVNHASAEVPIERKPEELFWTPQNDIVHASEIPNIVKTFSDVRLRTPSILEIVENESRESDDDPIFSARTYILNNGTNIPQTEVILVFHHGTWKFLYAQLGF